jgi:glycosyltransferase involved in cell wall biosynthesis
MRVLNVNASLDPVMGGGAVERTFQMSRRLVEAGADCTILTLDLGLTAERRAALGRVRLIALPCLNARFYLPRVSFGRIRSIVADADIVHLMGHWTVINALVFLAARGLGKPYVVCPAGALPLFGRSRLLKTLYNLAVGRRLVAGAARCIAVTGDERAHFRAYGVPEDRTVVIPNGISREDYQSRDDRGFRKRFGLGDAPFILFVGRLSPIKGPDLLLRAFGEARGGCGGFHLVFAGPDEGMLAGLRREAADSGLGERVHFLGYLGGADKSQAYHAASFLAIPSRQEAMSIVVLEAGIVGTPVLLTDQCGMNDVEVRGGGKVVAASAAGLRAGLTALCSAPERLPDMGKRLQDYVVERFLWSAIVKEYLALYEGLSGKGDLIESSSRPPRSEG